MVSLATNLEEDEDAVDAIELGPPDVERIKSLASKLDENGAAAEDDDDAVAAAEEELRAFVAVVVGFGTSNLVNTEAFCHKDSSKAIVESDILSSTYILETETVTLSIIGGAPLRDGCISTMRVRISIRLRKRNTME